MRCVTEYRPTVTPLVAVLVIQFLLVSWTFPLTALFSDVPLFYIDSAFHWAQIHTAHELALQGRLTGYDPFFAAGYVGGVTLNVSARIPALLSVALGGLLSEVQVYKLCTFMCALLGPACMVLAARSLGLARAPTWIAAALALCTWWASGFRWFHTAGMISFVLMSYLSIAYVALIIRTMRDNTFTIRNAVIQGVWGAAGWWLHPFFPIPVAVAVACYLIAEWRDIEWGKLVPFVSVVAVLCLLPNLPWIAAMLRADITAATAAPYQQRVDITSLPKAMLGLWRGDVMGAKLYPGLVAAATLALFATTGWMRRWIVAACATWLALALFASIGAAVPLFAQLQPNRFTSTAFLFLVLPAALGASLMPQALRDPEKRVLALCAGAVFAISFGASVWETAREISYRPWGHYGRPPPEVRGIGPRSRWVLEWLSTQTTAAGRVLFEDSAGRVHDGAHMAGYYALVSNREFIGGPYPYMLSPTYFDGIAFGRTLRTMTPQEFRQYLKLYNIGWIIAHSVASQNYLATVPGVVLQGEFCELKAYRVEQPLSYFLAGSGDVYERGINRLALTGLKGSDIVIKYHYVPGLSATPPTKLEPVWLFGIPRPFVRLRDAPASPIELTMR